jgi:hypothetical protein
MGLNKQNIDYKKIKQNRKLFIFNFLKKRRKKTNF